MESHVRLILPIVLVELDDLDLHLHKLIGCVVFARRHRVAPELILRLNCVQVLQFHIRQLLALLLNLLVLVHLVWTQLSIRNDGPFLRGKLI